MAQLKTYLVQYIAFGANNSILKNGTIRCKNRVSQFDAQAGLEKHLRKKVHGFERLQVLDIKVETPSDWLELFTDLHKKK